MRTACPSPSLSVRAGLLLTLLIATVACGDGDASGPAGGALGDALPADAGVASDVSAAADAATDLATGSDASATLDGGGDPGDGDAPDGGGPVDGGGDVQGEALDGAADLAADAGSADAGPPAPTRDEALAELRASTVGLPQWRFRTDPADEGVAAGWFGTDYDDGEWEVLQAGRTWEEQGHPRYDGVAWYRTRVFVPADWEGSPRIRLAASGVDDEYDVYVNGAHAGHYGEWPERSVWGWRTYSRLDGLLRYGEDNLIALRVVDWGGDGGLWRDVSLRRAVDLRPWTELLPEPILEANPEWVELYWFAWQQAFEKVSFGNEANGLSPAYLDEGFNEQIYQWDTCFMALFARYGLRLLPAMAALDNFYARQEPDGYIQRVYSETTGQRIGDPTPEEPMVNPPLFAWAEWEYWRFSGDTSRLERVLPVLERYYEWLRSNVSHAVDEQHRLYYQTELGSGMDNTPRGTDWRGTWADMSAQQGLAAWALARLWVAQGDSQRALRWDDEHAAVVAAVNRYLWNDSDDFYFDRTERGEHGWVRHLGGYWVLLARVAWPERAAEMIVHLRDPELFARRHLFPSLAANHPDYDPFGNYWHGGVWAPTNYMVIQGVKAYGDDELAHRAALNHLERLAEVYAQPPADEERIAPEERRASYRTLWECYAPDHPSPATRWDGQHLSRQDFVGWTGLGPIALLIEEALGVRVLAAEGRIVWTVRRLDRHGVRRLPFGLEATVDLVAEARPGPDAPLRVHTRATRAFELELRVEGEGPRIVAVPAGEGDFHL